MGPANPTPDTVPEVSVGATANELYARYITGKLALTDFAGLAINVTEEFLKDHPQPWTKKTRDTFTTLLTRVGRYQNIPRPLSTFTDKGIVKPGVIGQGMLALIALGKFSDLEVQPVDGFVEPFKRLGLHAINACAHYLSWNDKLMDFEARGHPYLQIQKPGMLSGKQGLAVETVHQLEEALPVVDLHKAAVLCMAEFSSPPLRNKFLRRNGGDFGLLIPKWIAALTDQDLALSIGKRVFLSKIEPRNTDHSLAANPDPPLTFKILATSFSARSICELSIRQFARTFARTANAYAQMNEGKGVLSPQQTVEWELAEIAEEIVLGATQQLRGLLGELDQAVIGASSMTEIKELGVQYCDAIDRTSKDVYGSVYTLCTSSADLTERCKNGNWKKESTKIFLKIGRAHV